MMAVASPRLGDVEWLLPEALLLVEATGRILDANPAACRVFDRTRDDLCARRLGDLATDAEQVSAYLRACTATRQLLPGALTIDQAGREVPFRCEGAVTRPADHRPAVALIRLRPRDIAGPHFKLLTSKVDELERAVTSRIRAEALLEGQRDVLELVASGAPLNQTLDELVRITEAMSPGKQQVSILLLDDDGRHLRDASGGGLPPAYREAIDGVEIGPAVGSCGTAAYENRQIIVTDIASDPRWADYSDLALSHGLRSCWSTPIRARDGSVLGTFALYYQEPKSPSAEDQSVVGLMTRVASIAIERSRADGQITLLLESERAARTEAEAANRAKDEFLAVVSHELRNPLNAILGWVALLQQGDMDAAMAARAIDTIARNARLQGELISDVLDFARVTSGRLTLDPQPTAMRVVIDRAFESVRPEAIARELSLEFDVDLPDRPVVLDANRLQQAVSNVLWNAIKFTPRGGRISLRAFRDEGQACIRISDTGIGIAPEFLPFVFERFRQSDASSSRQHGGLGLGLAIVHHIMTLHGGSVRAESDGVGRGATFTLSFPITMGGPSVQQLPKQGQGQSLAGLHVLVVEDVADARELLEATLGRSGARVTATASADQALAAMRLERPNVLVCDIGLPGTDGYQLMRAWRAQEQNGRTPAVALTAYSREVDRNRALEAGFDRHIPKPFDPVGLTAVVAELARS